MVLTMKIMVSWDVTLCSLNDLGWYFRATSCLHFQDIRVWLFHIFQIHEHYKCCPSKGFTLHRGSTTNDSSGQMFMVKVILLQVDVICRVWVTFCPHDMYCYKKRQRRETVPLKWLISRAEWITNNRWFREQRREVKKEKDDKEADERQAKVNK